MWGTRVAPRVMQSEVTVHWLHHHTNYHSPIDFGRLIQA